MAKLFKKSGSSQKAANKPVKTRFKNYQSFQLQKRITPEGGKLPGSLWLFGQALLLLKRNLKLFAGMAAVYSVLYLLLVQGVTALHGLDTAKETLNQSLSGLATGAALFAQLLGRSAALSATANTYQILITIVASLALIWTFRQVYGGKLPRIRDGFYLGMYPLVPFLLVLLVVMLELLPFAIGTAVVTTVINNGIAATGVEIALWCTGFLVLAVLSLYFITSSIFGLYIACLPNMEPMQALRSARELIRGRRWLVMRKVLFLPFALLLLAAALFIPAILYLTSFVGWLSFFYFVTALTVGHSYMYRLYRSLI